jgi:hypothetical protein
MRRVTVLVWLVLSTITLSLVALLVALFGDREETIHRMARLWARMYLAMAGINARSKGSSDSARLRTFLW